MIFKWEGRHVSNTVGRLAQKQPPFKECVTAHQNIPAFGRDGDMAPKMNGAKKSTEDGNVRAQRERGRGASHRQ